MNCLTLQSQNVLQIGTFNDSLPLLGSGDVLFKKAFSSDDPLVYILSAKGLQPSSHSARAERLREWGATLWPNNFAILRFALDYSGKKIVIAVSTCSPATVSRMPKKCVCDAKYY